MNEVPRAESLLEVTDLRKAFPGVVALDDVSWSIRPGEVHVLIGENGAGKSTLVKVVSGIYSADAGQMRLDGAPYEPATPQDALRAGVRVVHQELQLLPYLDVAENLTIESLPRRFGVVNRPAMHARARELLREVGLDVPTTARVQQLGIAQRQLLEIAKALGARSRLVILDEPTATLTPPEVDSLFAIVRRLRSEGVAILYISHHLEEMARIGDRVTVMRNGGVAAVLPVAGTTVPELVRLMVGRDVGTAAVSPEPVRAGTELLRVEDLRWRGNPRPVSFSLAEGEILGIAGLMGSGRTETVRALFGADPVDSGRILLRGREVRISSPSDAVAAGLSLLTEDRKGQGLLLTMSAAANVTLANLPEVTRNGLLDRAAEKGAAERYRRDLGIRTPTVATAVGTLSGGNQQKALLARWLFRGADVLVLDEPTRGIDVGAKFEIYALMRRLAAQGKGLLVVSSELPELMALCHRILVFSRGGVAGEVSRPAFDQEAILTLAYQGYSRPDTVTEASS